MFLAGDEPVEHGSCHARILSVRAGPLNTVRSAGRIRLDHGNLRLRRRQRRELLFNIRSIGCERLIDTVDKEHWSRRGLAGEGETELAIDGVEDGDAVGAGAVKGTTGSPPQVEVPGSGQAPPDASGPSLFTALKELGLKLELEKSPVDVVVIDHIERPSPN